jgi:hypothetical protein
MTAQLEHESWSCQLVYILHTTYHHSTTYHQIPHGTAFIYLFVKELKLKLLKDKGQKGQITKSIKDKGQRERPKFKSLPFELGRIPWPSPPRETENFGEGGGSTGPDQVFWV